MIERELYFWLISGREAPLLLIIDVFGAAFAIRVEPLPEWRPSSKTSASYERIFQKRMWRQTAPQADGLSPDNGCGCRPLEIGKGSEDLVRDEAGHASLFERLALCRGS
jgi:hypothetical protein